MKHLFEPPNDENKCEHYDFFNTTLTQNQLCIKSTTQCDYQYDFINLFKICYCNLEGQYAVAVLISFFLIFLNFRFISSVVESYLAPSIAYISEFTKMPEALSAVTLLALANGAGDVITALVACDSSGGLSYNVGAIYGAGLFVCSVIVTFTIHSSPSTILVEMNTLWRDVGFYIISTIVLIVFALIGQLTVLSTIIMLSIYLTLVLIVWYQETMSGKVSVQDKKYEEAVHPEKNQADKEKSLKEKDLIYIYDDKTEQEQTAFPKRWHQILNKFNTASGQARLKLLATKFKSTSAMLIEMKKKQPEEKEPQWEELSFSEKLLYVIDFPFEIIKKATLPPCNEENYDKFQATMFPTFGFLFIYFCLASTYNSTVIVGLIGAGLISSICIYFTSKDKQPPKFYILLQIFATVGALVWTYVACGILIDILQFLGMLSKLNKTFLGLTVIAVGNALPDGVTTIALAKQGYAIMGLTGAYAGQLFGLLVGLGLALLKKTLAEGPQQFDLFNPAKISDNFMNIFVIIVQLLVLLITFFYGNYTKYKYTKTLANVLGAIYAIFLIISIVIAIYKAIES